MWVALDNNCPKITQEQLEKAGHKVVYYARHEPDEQWVDDAYVAGAEVFISNDLDIGNMVDRMNDNTVHFIELPKRVRGLELAKWVVANVNRLSQRVSA